MDTAALVILIQGFSGGSLFLLTLFLLWKKRPLLPLLPFLLMTGVCSLWVLVDALRVFTAYASGPIHIVSPISGMLVVFTGWAVLNFGARFHSDDTRNKLRFIKTSIIVALCISLLCWMDNWSFNRRFEKGFPVADPGWPYFVTGGYALFQISLGIFFLIRRYGSEKQPIRKAQILYCVFGIAIFTFCAYIFSFILPVLNIKHLFFIGPSSAIIFVGILAWAILTRQFFNIRAAAFTFLFAVLYFLFFATASGLFLFAYGGTPASDSVKLFGICIALISSTYFYLQKIQPYLEKKASRYFVDFDELIRTIVNTTTAFALRTFDILCLRIADTFNDVLRLERVVICYQNENGEIVVLVSTGKNEKIQRVLRRHHRIFNLISPKLFKEDSPVSFWVEDIAVTRRIVDAQEHPKIANLIELFRDDLMGIGMDLYLPVSYKGRFLAHIFLGRKKNGEPFYRQEVAKITGLSGVIAVALKNNEVFGELYRLKEILKSENDALIHSSSILTEKIISLSEDRKIIYSGPAMEAVIDSIEKTAANDESALILGESGTGKELVALMIHEKSARRDRTFLSINCGSLNESLLQSELFGHEKGSFTGAVDRHEGVFEQASGGTLFLDEIGEMDLAAQVKLLRVLQERKITRVGGSNEIKVNVRIIAATNANLERLVQEGKFRLDLFYRLNVIKIVLPPLRGRKEDIPPLADHYLRTLAEKLGKGKMQITSEAMRMLQNHEWPGNVRQLENMLLRAIINATSSTLRESDFQEIRSIASGRDKSMENEINLLEKSELESIKIAMERVGGNKSHAAKILGLSRSTFYLKLRKYGLG